MSKRSFKIHFIIIGILLAAILILYLLQHIPFRFPTRQNIPTPLTTAYAPDSISRIEISHYKYNKQKHTQDVEIYFCVEDPNAIDGRSSQTIDVTICNQDTALTKEDFHFQWSDQKGTVIIHTSNGETQTLSFSIPQ